MPVAWRLRPAQAISAAARPGPAVSGLLGSYLRVHLWAALVVLAIAGFSCKMFYPSWQTESVVWGVVVIIAGALVAFFAHDEFDAYSPATFVGVSIALLYGTGLIVAGAGSGFAALPPIIESGLLYYPRAGLLTILSLLGFVVGYQNGFVVRKAQTSTLFCWHAPEPAIRRLFWVLMISGAWVYPVLLISNAAYQTTNELRSPLFYSALAWFEGGIVVSTGLALARYMQLRRLHDPNVAFWRVAALASFCGTAMFGFVSGSKAAVLLPICAAGMAWNYAYRRIPRWLVPWMIVIGMVFGLAMFAVVQQYRDVQVRNASALHQSLPVAARDMALALKELRYENAREITTGAIDYAATRLANISVTANILKYQDTGGSPKWGETYLRFFYALIPRIVWPNKPGITTGLEIAVELGYTGADTDVSRLGQAMSTTSVAITLVGEAVYNFAWFGPLAMILMGALYRTIYEYFRTACRLDTPIAIGIYAFVWFEIVFNGQETNAAALVSGTLKYGIVLLIVFKLLGIQRARMGQPAPLTVRPVRAGARTMRTP